ncbi:MAG: GH3 auxin-responsive promoter family protein [Flavobacteriales bacterium]
MAVKGNILQSVLKGSTRIGARNETKTPIQLQKRALKRLLRRAKETKFGKAYRFNKILKSDNELVTFQRFVPIHDYDSMYESWWKQTIEGEEDVTWPGKISRFALSSGTSGSASKQIPVSRSFLRKIRRISLKQIQGLNQFELPKEFFNTFILGVGGCTSLTKIEKRKEGDLSGIINANLPSFMNVIYKPEKEITDIADWDLKIDKMVDSAPEWNIGIITGIPSWIQILLEKIIERYNLNNIHELWPNFSVMVHGGVAFGPYKKNFEKLLGKPIIYMETYLASEGFMAISPGNGKPLRLLLNNGIFFEFIPFTEDNFNQEGELVRYPEVITVDKVKKETTYAVVLSTCSGSWRYMLGDTIQFVDTEKCEIIITGRTKHYLTICGEHLSVDNMSRALEITSNKMGIEVPEFSVTAFAYENLFAHRWYIGSDDNFDKEEFKNILDNELCILNDDYKTERSAALKEIFIESLPVSTFYNFLDSVGKKGAQTKFPRVIKGELMDKWKEFLNQ